jgi:hypothetical protein
MHLIDITNPTKFEYFEKTSGHRQVPNNREKCEIKIVNGKLTVIINALAFVAYSRRYVHNFNLEGVDEIWLDYSGCEGYRFSVESSNKCVLLVKLDC